MCEHKGRSSSILIMLQSVKHFGNSAREAKTPRNLQKALPARTLTRVKKEKMAQTKRFRNRYAKSAKYSEYKLLQLLECFARDLSIKEAARLTKMTERTIRDRYEDIRAKIFKWCFEAPFLFNGLGFLLTDSQGQIEMGVLEVLFFISQTLSFQKRMASHYPKYRTQRDPALHHVIEIAARRFCAIDPPQIDNTIQNQLLQLIQLSKSEIFITAMKHPNIPARTSRQLYWQTLSQHSNQKLDTTVRHYPNTQGIAFFKDLKWILRKDPI